MRSVLLLAGLATYVVGVVKDCGRVVGSCKLYFLGKIRLMYVGSFLLLGTWSERPEVRVYVPTLRRADALAGRVARERRTATAQRQP